MNDIVLLVDVYSDDSRRLHESLIQAGIACPVYCLEDDGFLPDGVESVFSLFMGDYSKKAGKGRPCFFNEIEVPDMWEISGTSSYGSIHDLTKERGRIFYAEPKNRRFVKIVDWKEENGTVRFSDHYNRWGFIFARTVFNKKGEKVNKTYFDTDGRVVIEENFVTKNLILTENGKLRLFASKMDFLKCFAEKMELRKKRIVYNTLSTSFFLSESLPDDRHDDILFWQEKKRPDIPGNMVAVLEKRSRRTSRIFVQDRAAYEELIRLGGSEDVLKPLGHIYSFKRENSHSASVLISTNSDQLVNFEMLVKTLPEVTFYVTAVTEMSSKLMEMEKYGNVKLYPCVKPVTQDKLMDSCDIYLDINQGGEILDSVYEAFLHNLLILAFKENIHNASYICPDHIFDRDSSEQMVQGIRAVIADHNLWDARLREQRENAMVETKEKYKKLIQYEAETGNVEIS